MKGLVCILLVGLLLPAVAESDIRVLNERFMGEGACAADIDGDGVQDVVSGAFWYKGPDFKTSQRYAAGGPYPVKGYSGYFFCFAGDFNKDGRTDILVVGFPGQNAHWFENPGESNELWTKRLAHAGVGNESPCFRDVTGNGSPELLFNHKNNEIGYATPSATEEPWPFVRIGDGRGCGHGLGVGDVNSDGTPDVLIRKGWFEGGSADVGQNEPWTFHAVNFGAAGGADMWATDVDGDGDSDVITAKSAHGWGLSWFEQTTPGEFVEHPILTDKAADSPYGLAVSQLHAIELADFDGDGIKDIVTGKRYWAHNGKDPAAAEPQALLWFRIVRGQDGKKHAAGVRFEPHLIHSRIGVGTQVSLGSLDADPRPDVIVGNKLGTFVALNPGALPAMAERESPAFVSGGSGFTGHVRASGPLDPAEEQAAFHLPPGFSIELVASEPDIQKPLNMAFDERGRLWVTCSIEYPFPAEAGKGRDTIKILEETSSGIWKTTTFADNLNIPIGLMPWKDGVICFSMPDILFLRDTDGDGRADQRTHLYGPFDITRDTHGMVNAMTLAPDGWIHACHGFNNQSEVAGADGHKVTMHSGNTFRFRPDGSRIEHVSHGQVNPFGMSWGPHHDLFTADCHSKPITLIMPGSWHTGFGRKHDGRGFLPELMKHSHGSTAICGLAWGGDTHFPKAYQDCFLSGDVTGGRLNRNRMVYQGSTPRAVEQPDFLLCDDPWFRPADLQVAPDGSVFISDFYNKIIGHYEVDLKHPGRDRHRGRIWRIRHDTPGKPQAAVDPVIVELQSGKARPGRVRALLAAQNPLHRRQAAMAASKAPDPTQILALMDALAAAPPADTYLVYALKLALRVHLQDEDNFAKLLRTNARSSLSPARREVLVTMCLNLRSEPAARYLAGNVEHLQHLPTKELQSAVKLIARHVEGKAAAELVALVRDKFAANPELQFELLDAMHDGLSEGGATIPIPLLDWAEDLAQRHLNTTGPAVTWAYAPLPGEAAGSDNPFVPTTRRKSSDGMENTPLWSSIPKGEKRTGMHVSSPFVLNAGFSFYLAGHDGFPDKPPMKQNRVELRLAENQQVIQSWSPPRNDTAQPMRWRTGEHAGKRVQVVMIDGDPAGAFAWLAAGRFSEPALNPSKAAKNWTTKAMQVARRFKLASCRPQIRALLREDSPHAFEAGRTIATLADNHEWAALAELLPPGMAGSEIQKAIRQILGGASETASTNLLLRAFGAVPLAGQRRMAQQLVNDPASAGTLLAAMQSGVASARLLSDESLRQQLEAVLPDAKAVLARLVKDLPSSSDEADEMIETRLAFFRKGGSNIAAGKTHCKTHCLACHQIAGEGQRLAPNLDGIGRRGAARLAEDILAPHRNVDLAFRISRIHLKDGRLVTGFIKQREGAQWLLADATGQEQRVPAADIAREQTSRLSLMPAIFGESLDESEFRDLMAYLLSLR